jgi:hypothetical protein
MDYAKKVALVPQQFLDKIAGMHQQQPQTVIPPLGTVLPPLQDTGDTVQWRLLEEINGIYYDRSMPDDVRAKNMQQVHHLLGSIRKIVHPIRIRIEAEDGSNTATPPDAIATVPTAPAPPPANAGAAGMMEPLFNEIPKKHRAKAKKLVAHLKSTVPGVTWDNAGVVSVNGQVIPDSSITKIAVDLAMPRSNSIPVGIYQVGREIMTTSARPARLIKNRQRMGQIRRNMAASNGENTSDVATGQTSDSDSEDNQHGSGIKKFKWHSF